MNAFARLDVPASYAVVREDELVDEEYDAIARQCITFMMEDPRSIKRSMNVTWAARALERIGDHAKNICEYVIFMVEGKDVRHTDLDETVDDA
jgi:phosphate transport system protein